MMNSSFFQFIVSLRLLDNLLATQLTARVLLGTTSSSRAYLSSNNFVLFEVTVLFFNFVLTVDVLASP